MIGGGWGKICFLLDFFKGYLGVILGIWLAGRLEFNVVSIAKLLGAAGAVLAPRARFQEDIPVGKSARMLV